MSAFRQTHPAIRTPRTSTVSARRGQLSGAIPLAPQVSKFRHTATRMTVSIGVAVLVVMATVAPVASASSSDVPPPDKTALIMGATTIPTPDEFWVESVMNQYIEPTHRGPDDRTCRGDHARGGGPLTGIFRLLFSAFGPPEIWGPGSAAWPDEPWWKLSGLFDLTFDQSVQAGVADLEAAMAAHGNDDLVIYGYSQGAAVAIAEKRKLAAQYPSGIKAPDIDFVLGGDGNLPNGGIFCPVPRPLRADPRSLVQRPRADRHPVRYGRHHPAVRLLADFPLYPLNLVALLTPCWAPSTSTCTASMSAWLPIPRRRRLSRTPTATPPTTSSRLRTCRYSLRCAPWGCPSR